VKAAILADGDLRALAVLVRREISKLDRQLAVDSIRTMDDHVSEVVAPQRFVALLVGVFAAMALLLASVGLYGLLAYTTAQRRKEIAVRMALGAERPTVMRMVIGEGARLVGAGLLIGLLGALAVSRLVASLLYQTGSFDPLVFAIVPGVLGSVTFLACALPAWHATRVEPVSALRTE
jgi:putative ABC transport system permease protein